MPDSAIPFVSNQVRLIEIINPFDPRQRVHRDVAWAKNLTLDAYLPLYEGEFVASVSGRVVAPDEFALTYPAPGDCIVFCPVPSGGGGGKNVLRMVAMIAVAVMAPYAAAAMMGTTVATMGVAGSLLAAGLTISGALLVNALLPVSPIASSNRSFSDSPTYGIDGPRNSSVDGIPIPVCYGLFRMAGNLINTKILPNGSTQDLYLMFAAGEGEVAYLNDVLVNDVPIASYKNWDMRTSIGSGDTAGCEWFDGIYTSIDQGAKLLSDTDWCNYTTQTAIDQFRVDLVAQGGLFDVDDQGNVTEVSVPILIEYCEHGTNNWQALADTVNIAGYVREETHWYRATDGILKGAYLSPAHHAPASVVNTGTPVIDGSQGGPIYDGNQQSGTWRAVPQMTGNTVMQDKTRSATRAYFMSGKLTPAIYDIRVQRTTAQASVSNHPQRSDAITLSDIVEIVNDKVGYKNLAWVAIKITLYDQLNQIPKVTYMNGGRLINVYAADGSVAPQPSGNPAWITLDMLTHSRYGGGMDLSRFDMEKWREWAAWCDANNLTFNGVIDTDQNLWDALQFVLRCGHAQIVNIGTRYSVAIERADDPVMLFTVANIVENSFQENWLSMSDRANEIDVTYTDKNDLYRAHTIKVVDGEKLAAGYPVNNSSITLYGVTDADRAYEEGLLLLNLNRYVTQTVKFDVSVDALACTVGDVILVQHDMPQWGYAGLIKGVDASLTAIIVDRPMAMEAGKTYSFMCLHDTLQRAAGSVSSVIGNSVFLSGYNGVDRVRRLMVAGVEYEVQGYFPAAGATQAGVVVTNAAGIAAGADYGLYDQDVIETQIVSSVSADGLTLTLAAALQGAPVKYSRFAFGEVSKITKPFRVRTIDASQEYTRTLTCLEYNASIYDLTHDAVPTPDYSALPGAVAQVSNLAVSEDWAYVGDVARVRLLLTWQNSSPTYRKAAVYVSINGLAYSRYSEGAASFVVEASKGDTVKFKVVAIDAIGNSAPYSTAPELTHVVGGKDIVVADPTGLTATGDVFQIFLQAAVPALPDTEAVEYYAASMSADIGAKIGESNTQDTKFTHLGLDAGHTLYYRCRIRDTSGNFSGYYPAPGQPGIAATTVTAPDRILALLNSAITTSQLAQSLQDDILSTQGVGDLANQLEANAADMIAGWLSLNDNMDENRSNVQRLDGIDGQILTINDNITTEQAVRQALSVTVDSLSSSMTSEQSARLSADQANSQAITSLTSTVSGNKASADQSIATLTSATNSQAQTLSSLQTTVNGNTSGLSSEQQTRANADSSLSARIDTLVASSGGNTAGLDQETQARVNGDNALSDQITSLTTTVNNNDSTQTANLTTEQQTRANGDSANASSITSLQGTVSSNNSAVNARIDSVLALNLDASTALMTRFSGLDATISSNNSTVTGKINDIQNLNLTSTTALMTRFSGLDSTVSNNYNTLNGKYADILNLNIASGTTLMTKINTLQSSVNGNTASISSNASALASVQNGVTTLNAQMVFKTDAYGHIAGIGLASTGTGSGNATSSVLIYADKIGFLLPGAGAGAAPIPVFTSGYVNGVATTGVNGAVFLDGTITAKAISVASLSAVSASMGTVTIDSAGWLRGGQTDFNTGSGFFLGASDGKYKFSIGDGGANTLTWDGTSLRIRGDLTLKSYTPGSILVHNNSSAVWTQDTSWHRMKATQMPRPGVISVKFDLGIWIHSGSNITAEIRVNGVPISGTRGQFIDPNPSFSQTPYQQFQTYGPFNITVNDPQDVIEVWASNGWVQGNNANYTPTAVANLAFYCGPDGVTFESDIQ